MHLSYVPIVLIITANETGPRHSRLTGLALTALAVFIQ